MPKVKRLIREDPRAAEIRGEIGRMKEMSGKSYRYLCLKAGIPYRTFMRHRQDIGNLKHNELWKFADICEKEAKR